MDFIKILILVAGVLLMHLLLFRCFKDVYKKKNFWNIALTFTFISSIISAVLERTFTSFLSNIFYYFSLSVIYYILNIIADNLSERARNVKEESSSNIIRRIVITVSFFIEILVIFILMLVNG